MPQIAAALTPALPEPASPPAQGMMQIELNRASDSEPGHCNLIMIATNQTGKALRRAAWQVAVFDQDGLVRVLPVLDFGPLIIGKNKIGVFAMSGGGCDTISRIIVNDVAECTGEDGADLSDICLQSLETNSRSDIEFGL
ncbi:MAG: hypothetical protein Q4G26_05030 [Paracoccus sp. (in: a-proteobacteria)]|nr:hypothetical protein [Paracoccus sp. (in: a-proteobacteria)]